MNRHGYTLVEMVAVISVSMAALGIAAGLVHSAFDVERSLRQRLAQRQVVDRLAEQFRRDVHAASEVIVETDPVRCELTGRNGASIVYRTEGAMLVRETSGEEGSSSSVAIHRAAQAVFSAACEGDSPIFAAETVDGWARTPSVPRKLGQAPCDRLSSSQHGSRTDFPLPRRCTVVFDRFEQAGRTLVGLTIVPKPGSDAPARQAPQPVRIDALLDRHAVVAGAQLPPVEPSGDMP